MPFDILSPVGIVQDIAVRWIRDVETLLAGGVKAIEPAPVGGAVSRVRGVRDKPSSSA